MKQHNLIGIIMVPFSQLAMECQVVQHCIFKKLCVLLHEKLRKLNKFRV